MPKSTCTVNAQALGAEIAKELDEMNNTGFGSSTVWAIGEYLGMQVQIRITRDEDELLELDEEPLLAFGRER